jgi:hypothetical protein
LKQLGRTVVVEAKMAAEIDNRTLDTNPEEFIADPLERIYRDALADGLESVLGKGAETLEEIATGLNEASVTARKGELWTAETLEAELRRVAE